MIFLYHETEDIYTKRTYKGTKLSVVMLDGFVLISKKLAGSFKQQCGSPRNRIYSEVGS